MIEAAAQEMAAAVIEAIEALQDQRAIEATQTELQDQRAIELQDLSIEETIEADKADLQETAARLELQGARVIEAATKVDKCLVA